jgi:hypothetical protein
MARGKLTLKRCPSCNHTYEDQTLSFCLEDGTPLVHVSAGRADSQETLVSPSFPAPSPRSSSELPATQVYGQLPGTAANSGSQFQPPAVQPYAPVQKPRRTWLWVIAILIMVFVIGGIVIAAIVIPPMLRASTNDNRPQPTPTRPVSKPSPTVSPVAEADDVPDDDDEVFAQLSKLEDEWTRANVKGDKEALEKILADEYVGGPTTHSKREYIDSLTPDPSVKSWDLSDLTVELDGDRATMQGTLSEETANGPTALNFSDTFVWRDHRWQAVASHTRGVK